MDSNKKKSFKLNCFYYPNRKIYCPENAKYSSQSELSHAFITGDSVSLTCKHNGKDLTYLIHANFNRVIYLSEILGDDADRITESVTKFLIKEIKEKKPELYEKMKDYDFFNQNIVKKANHFKTYNPKIEKKEPKESDPIPRDSEGEIILPSGEGNESNTQRS